MMVTRQFTQIAELSPTRLVPLMALLAALTSCGTTYTPPAAPTPREATPVAASAGRTWEAVIELFADRNIPIRTIERASGLIVTDQLSVGREGIEWADCGETRWAQGDKKETSDLPPTHATYNVLVRGDSARSTVKATVRWSHALGLATDVGCTSSHVWEDTFERTIKESAEAGYAAAGSTAAASQSAAGTSVPASPPPAPKPAVSPPPQVRPTPPPADLPRANAELLEAYDFRLAADDVLRLGLVSVYGETARGTLVVDLTQAAMSSTGTEYNLARLYDGYRRTLVTDEPARLELRLGGSKVGEYTRNGLVKIGRW